MRKFLLLIAMCVAVATGATLPAETVTIDPGNGISTNVTERFTGEVDGKVILADQGNGDWVITPYAYFDSIDVSVFIHICKYRSRFEYQE